MFCSYLCVRPDILKTVSDSLPPLKNETYDNLIPSYYSCLLFLLLTIQPLPASITSFSYLKEIEIHKSESIPIAEPLLRPFI